MPNINNQKYQITEALKQRYFPMILQLQQNWTSEQHEKNRLSRSLAAFAIEKLACVMPAQSSYAVVDGGNDNGIDAIHFDRIQNCLWLIQAKAGSAPNMGDNKKFCDGIRDLVNRRFHKFNTNFARLQRDVEDALESNELQIIGCNVYLDNGVGSHIIADLDQLKNELNQFVQRFDWKDLKLSIVHNWLTTEHVAPSIQVALTLEKWYGINHPRRAFYGLVTAEQLALLYQQHGKAIFEKNIRYYLGAEGVNSAIAATVQDEPSELFYLNNGLTAVCAAITPAPGVINESGLFTLEGFSIVNGAQTVGSIATVRNATGEIPSAAKLMITLIEIGTVPDTLGTQITRARNTQNAVRDLHFAALSPEQERLRQELAVSGITYQYRPSGDQGGLNVITIEQAIIALACFTGITQIIVTAKRERGQLYPQFGETLFSPALSGLYLYRSVQIFQYLDGIFAASEQAETESRRKMFYRHSRFFILHILARKHPILLKKAELILSETDKTELSRTALELAESIYTIAESQFSNGQGYLAMFRNLTDVDPLARAVMQTLEQQQAAT
jgi:hypothetical protein